MKQTRLREGSLSVSSVHQSLLICPSGYSSSPPFMNQSLSSIVFPSALLQQSSAIPLSIFKAPLRKTGTVTIK